MLTCEGERSEMEAMSNIFSHTRPAIWKLQKLHEYEYRVNQDAILLLKASNLIMSRFLHLSSAMCTKHLSQ